jgi:hypothetical protein
MWQLTFYYYEEKKVYSARCPLMAESYLIPAARCAILP